MKTIILSSITLFATISFTACNKCSHCTVKDNNGTIVKDYTEKCGTNEDISNYEKSASEDAKQYSGTFKCD